MNFHGNFHWQVQGGRHFREGGNSYVYRVNRPNDEREYALKHYRLEADPSSQLRFDQEVKIVQMLSGIPNCVQYIDHGVLDSKPFYVMPFFKNGTLRDKYINQVHNFSVIDRLNEFIVICQRVALIHDSDLAIRDIKPQNILIDDSLSPVLADFGLSMWINTPDDDRKTSTFEKIGSRGYRPPEWHSRYPEPNQRPGDIWSLGRTLWAMMAGQNPPDNYETLGASGNHLNNYMERQSANIVQSIISSCTSQDPQNRPDIAALVVLARESMDLLSASSTTSDKKNLNEILKQFSLQVSHSSTYIDAARADSEINIKASELNEALLTLQAELGRKVEELNALTPELIGRFEVHNVMEGSAFLATQNIKTQPSLNSSQCGYTCIRFNSSKKIRASTGFEYTALLFYLGITKNNKFFWVVQLGYGSVGSDPIIDEVETVALIGLVEHKKRQLDTFVAKLVGEIERHF